MSEELNTSPSKPSLDTGAMAVDALARRRVLLSGLGKGSVVLAAASVPMHTLASTSTRCKTDGHTGQVVWATVSGCHSAVGSRIPADTPVSQGYHCSHYTQKSCWPGYNRDPRKDTSCVNKKFNDIFPGTSDNRTCYDIVKNDSSSSSCRWVTAFLNAQTCVSKNYPYNSSEIVTHYRQAGSNGYPSRQDCESFFGTHMESCYS
ncbi:hypothetical protein [Rhodoferax sp. GW822-FHT02A01]|uniref:hypothetical protein n=1 Tax=Rhodoferax sp. GW822-FHT02A01 TaxID=3141537 RepID=UPI00315C4D2B